jgi:hypothetical protein
MSSHVGPIVVGGHQLEEEQVSEDHGGPDFDLVGTSQKVVAHEVLKTTLATCCQVVSL